MLKLTFSFCRYLRLTCGCIHYNSSHVKSFTQLSPRKSCGGVHTGQPLSLVSPLSSSSNTGDHLRLLGNNKKKLRPKRKALVTSNDVKKPSQMGDSYQPTLSHVSYGGQFEVSPAENDSSTQEWNAQFTGNQTANNTGKYEPVIIPPDFRVWETVSQKVDDGKTIKFKLLSYNVLAQYLLECHPYLYTDCGPHNLKWSVRARKLYDEIIKIGPDIICLQEVQSTHLSTFYSKFEEVGYTGIYKQKTGHRFDGCAIYYKKSLFELVEHVSVEFYQPEMPILNRDNIGVMVKLSPKGCDTPVVVATTHLLYNPKRTDVRLAQLQVLLAELDRFAYYNNGRESGHLPIILTGDFNSTPESAVIKLLDRGFVSAGSLRDTSDWRKIGVTDNCQHLSVHLNRQQGLATDFSMTKIHNSDYRESQSEADAATELSKEQVCEMFGEMFNSGQLSHSLGLASTYTKSKDDGSQEATTFQDYWVTVDYIYFSYCSTLRLIERLRLPTELECTVLRRLPNDVYGSDHLALAAVFELASCKSSL